MDLQLDKIDVLLHQISDEIQEVATLTRASKNSTEDFQSTQENHSLNYNEDDFINIINGHQYIIDDLREAYKAISGARMQFAMIIQDHMSLMNKYDLHNYLPYSGDAEAANSGNYMRTSALKKHYCRKRSLARKAVYENFRFMKSLTGGICKLQY